MRILLVNQYFPPDASATAYLIGELAEDLSSTHHVSVLAGRPSYNPESSTFRPRGVRVRRAWSTRFGRAGIGGRLTNYATFVLSSLAEAMRAPRPDVVVAFTDPPVIGLVGLLAAIRHRCPFVYVCEDIFPDVGVALRRIDNPVVVATLRRLNRVLRRRAARVVAIGRDMQAKLLREGVRRDTVTLIPNWATPMEADLDRRLRSRASMGWGDDVVVMHAGNMGLAQNLDIVLDAAASLAPGDGTRWVFVGDGAARSGLERRVRDEALGNVEFIPYLPKDRAQVLTEAADLHLISLRPGLGGAVVPSKMYGIMAAGRPFVAAVDRGSEPHLVVEDHGCGSWIPAGDVASLAAAVKEARDSDLDAIGERGRAALIERYSRAVATAKYRSMLEDLVGQPARSRDVVPTRASE